jgi:hypothetical protein
MSSQSSISRIRPLPKSKAVLKYLDQLAASINERGDGLQSSDLRQAQQNLGNYNLESIKVSKVGILQLRLLT